MIIKIARAENTFSVTDNVRVIIGISGTHAMITEKHSNPQ